MTGGVAFKAGGETPHVHTHFLICLCADVICLSCCPLQHVFIIKTAAVLQNRYFQAHMVQKTVNYTTYDLSYES